MVSLLGQSNTCVDNPRKHNCIFASSVTENIVFNAQSHGISDKQKMEEMGIVIEIKILHHERNVIITISVIKKE